jgi:hypothetical protein
MKYHDFTLTARNVKILFYDSYNFATWYLHHRLATATIEHGDYAHTPKIQVCLFQTAGKGRAELGVLHLSR